MSFFSRKRAARAVVAVLADPVTHELAVAFNYNWGGYAFPTQPFAPPPSLGEHPTRAAAVRAALCACRNDFGLPDGAFHGGHWMDRVEVEGRSGSTRNTTRYVYDVVTIDMMPGTTFPRGTFGSPMGMLTRDRILSDDPALRAPVTWTTHDLLERLLRQRAAVGIAERQGTNGPEYFVVPNHRGDWFFPACRLPGTGGNPAQILTSNINRHDNRPYVTAVGSGVRVDHTQVHSALGLREYAFEVFALEVRAGRDLLQLFTDGDWMPRSDILAATPSAGIAEAAPVILRGYLGF